MTAIPTHTWDGVPIAPDEPHGATVLVRRPAERPGEREYLVLHRAHNGPDYEGDWAWTPPGGARQPGEAVLPAALRELAEETGLQAGNRSVRALDLSRHWVRFGLDVPAGTEPRLDAEHDRFEWLPPAEATGRCMPAVVARAIRLAEAALAAQLEFRPLAMADLPALLAWLNEPHVARWYAKLPDLAAAERKYGPRIAGDSATRVHVLMVDGRDCGFAQHYRVGDYPDYATATGLPEAVGIDYAIGAAELTGRGLGSQLVWSYLRDVALPAHPAARQAVASPEIANTRSIRVLAKAGFGAAAQISVPGEPAPERLCVLDVVKFFGPRVASGPDA